MSYPFSITSIYTQRYALDRLLNLAKVTPVVLHTCRASSWPNSEALLFHKGNQWTELSNRTVKHLSYDTLWMKDPMIVIVTLTVNIWSPLPTVIVGARSRSFLATAPALAQNLSPTFPGLFHDRFDVTSVLSSCLSLFTLWSKDF
jgi:hypothetical protein